MKRPPLPAVQTNGVQSSQSSRSPSTSSKRAPGFKHPPTPTVNGVNGVNGETNGLGPRLSNRRKDSQKPGDGRPTRPSRAGQEGERKIPKKITEPYVRTQSYILKKYRNKPPSLIIHLHPTHFRFDTQDGSFSYNSPMKIILEHLRAQTVPHDIMEELITAGTRFYEGCLIVQVQDHKSNANKSSSGKDATQDDGHVPFSIHNYSEHLTPSPYAPYPQKAQSTANGDSATSDHQESSVPRDKQLSKGPNIFHIVLFPTPLSMHEEVVIQANTVDPKAQNNRKQSSAVPRTPASATVPPTPTFASSSASAGPPAKKQKMTISGHEIHGFESKIIQSTAPPLFLDPVEDLEGAHKVLNELTDPRHKEAYPAPKVKKRTEAELAADEAIAAQEEAFMLIMDERHSSGNAAGRAGATDGENGIPTFQPNFEQWQALRNIKAEHKERHAREQEAKKLRDEAQQANKLRIEQQEQANRQEMERRAAHVSQNQAHINMARQAQVNKEMQVRERQRQAALAASHTQPQIPHSHPMPNGISRAQNSSPVVRNQTPNNNSSPTIGHVPMNVTTSGQGVTSSPARPGSAMQHNGQSMVRQISRQRAPSRTSTPQMNGTPSMSHATPVMGPNATPRMPSQGSPPIHGGPVMNQNMMQPNGQPLQLTSEQQHSIDQRRMQHMYLQRQQQQQQIQIQQQRLQNGSPNPQMSPEQRAAAHMQQNLQHQATLNQQRQQEYQQSLRMQQAAQGHANMPNGASPPQQHPSQMQPQSRHSLTPQQKQQINAQTTHNYHQLIQQLAQAKYGGNIDLIPQPERHQAENKARSMAQDSFKKQFGMIMQQKMREQQQQQAALNLQMAQMNGMGSGGGVGGMQGVNGQGMSAEQRQAIMQGMQQMGQMPHMGGQGVNGMHGGHMNGMGGMQ